MALEQPLWTVDELVAATGGKLTGPVTAALNGVSIDTRTLAAGDIFVAIRGAVHDGHKFVADALRSGAGLAVVSNVDEEMRKAGPLLVVPEDPLRGLENIGRASRARSRAQIVAITGSVGKTSTKDMLRVALSASGSTHASAASFNNHWGVPLSLARMPRNAAFGVFEIGMNHAGEITPLVGFVKPHVAIITAIAASHLGHFKSLDEIAAAKAEIFSGVVKGGYALVNRDTPYYQFLAERARGDDVLNVTGFGQHADAEVRLERLVVHENCCCVTARVFGDEVIYKLGVPGAHMAGNSLAVLGAVKLMGADLARGALALAAAQPAKGRGIQQRLRADGGELLLIDESYNANPASVNAALALLGQARLGKGGRRIAVLGDMLELGEFGAKLHGDLAGPVEQARVDALFAAGPLMSHLWERVPSAMRAGYAESSEGLKDRLLAELRPGDIVMIKGSLGSRMGPLVEAIKAQFPPASKDS